MTGNRQSGSWNRHYESVIAAGTLVDWEKLPCDDLKGFLTERKLVNLSTISTVLEVGCGRGFRSMTYALGLLNRSGVAIYEVDIAPAAIKYAREFLDELRLNRSCGHPRAVCEPFKKDLPRSGDIRCSIIFEALDFITDELPEGLDCPRFAGHFLKRHWPVSRSRSG